MVKILVIEDEEDIRDEVMEWLRFEGYEVVGADNGRRGLETIQQDIPDLIVCDIAMPEMDGHELLIEVRSDSKLDQIPFIFLTASADRDSMRTGMNLGADDYLTKPFTHVDVLSAIRSRLGKKAAQEMRMRDQLDLLNTAVTEERHKRMLKSRLVAMFSHDFRNPLASILASSSIIRTYDSQLSPERKSQHFDRIDGSVRLLIQMLDDMLIVAAMEAGHLAYSPQPIDLSSFVEGIVEDFRLIDEAAHKLTFHNNLQDRVEADPKLLRQILSNLISNAIKYSPPGSEVIITVGKLDHRIHLIVQDQGIGIPKESLPLLFEPFHRASNVQDVKGTGLGLSIVRDCVECHNGRIEVESQVGKGTTFTVELPLIAS